MGCSRIARTPQDAAATESATLATLSRLFLTLSLPTTQTALIASAPGILPPALTRAPQPATIRRSGQPRPPVRTRHSVPAPGGRLDRAHARRVGDGLRGCRADAQGADRSRAQPAAPGAALSPAAGLRAARTRDARCGPTTRTSTRATTSATPRCRAPRTRPRSSSWRGGCSPSAWTAPSRCGRSGSCSAWPAGGSR